MGFCADACVVRDGKKYHLGRESSIMVLATVFLHWREGVARCLGTWISWVDVSWCELVSLWRVMVGRMLTTQQGVD